MVHNYERFKVVWLYW